MEPLLVALEPEPTWLGELSVWRVDGQFIHNQEDLSRIGLAGVAPPQIGYIWTKEGAFNLEEQSLIFKAVLRLGQVFLWTWLPFQQYISTVKDPVLTLPGLGDLKDAPEKMAGVVQVRERHARYWAAVRIEDKEDALMRQAMRSFHLHASLLLTTHSVPWREAAEELTRELELERRVAEKEMLLEYFLFKTIVRLMARGDLLLRHLNIESDRSVIMIYGQPEKVRQLIDGLTQFRPTQLVQPQEMWKPPE